MIYARWNFWGGASPINAGYLAGQRYLDNQRQFFISIDVIGSCSKGIYVSVQTFTVWEIHVFKNEKDNFHTRYHRKGDSMSEKSAAIGLPLLRKAIYRTQRAHEPDISSP